MIYQIRYLYIYIYIYNLERGFGVEENSMTKMIRVEDNQEHTKNWSNFIVFVYYSFKISMTSPQDRRSSSEVAQHITMIYKIIFKDFGI